MDSAQEALKPPRPPADILKELRVSYSQPVLNPTQLFQLTQELSTTGACLVPQVNQLLHSLGQREAIKQAATLRYKSNPTPDNLLLLRLYGLYQPTQTPRVEQKPTPLSKNRLPKQPKAHTSPLMKIATAASAAMGLSAIQGPMISPQDALRVIPQAAFMVPNNIRGLTTKSPKLSNMLKTRSSLLQSNLIFQLH